MAMPVLYVVAGVVILAAVAFAVRVRSSSRVVVRNMQAVLKEADSVNMESKRLVKFTSKGSVAYIAKVTPDGNGTVRLDLEVSDTGIGKEART